MSGFFRPSLLFNAITTTYVLRSPVMSEQKGGRGATADQLTLYQLDSAIMPPKLILSPPDFQNLPTLLDQCSHSSCCRRLAALKSVLNYSMYRVRVCNSLTFLEFLNMAKEHEISCGIFNEAKTFVKLHLDLRNSVYGFSSFQRL